MEWIVAAVVEIVAEPDRLDLNDIHAHAAKSGAVKVAFSTDARSVNAFQYLSGWLTADGVINTRTLAA